jgi:hypothetical protein
MKTATIKLINWLIALTDRIIYAFQMYPTKNPNVVTGVSRTALPDGTINEYLGAILPSELKRNKVKAI